MKDYITKEQRLGKEKDYNLLEATLIFITSILFVLFLMQVVGGVLQI